MKKIFKLAYDDTFHIRYHRTYNAITKKIYIWWLAHHLKQYITFCPQCNINQTIQHALYGDMNAIAMLMFYFHTICIDFIMALPISSSEKYNNTLIVINKFSKKKLLILGPKNMIAKSWVDQLLDYLRLCNWSISKAMISDRDLKFRSDLWKELFKQLKVDLLVSTAYHSQSDGQSKRTN